MYTHNFHGNKSVVKFQLGNKFHFKGVKDNMLHYMNRKKNIDEVTNCNCTCVHKGQKSSPCYGMRCELVITVIFTFGYSWEKSDILYSHGKITVEPLKLM